MTFAWCTIHLCKHFPSTGQLSLTLLLHDLFSVCSWFFKLLALCWLFNTTCHIHDWNITNLYCVSVEYLSKAMVSWEMFMNEFKEFFTYVCFNIYTEEWITPDHLPILISSCILGWFFEFQCCLVSIVFKCCFVCNLSFVKLSFVTE